jgi:hypothetical protein
MTLQEDIIVDIKETQIKYFGGPGKLLLPSVATIEAAIKEVPEHKLITTSLLRKRLADRFNVQGTCPVTTKKALQAIANDPTKTVAYWRVIKQNGELMAYYPDGVMGHAAHLLQEGFSINATGKVPKVEQFKSSLIQIE